MYKFKYQVSKTKAKEFAIKMQEIDDFCRENGIVHSKSRDSYYFSIDGKNYRVSNHTVAASNSKAFNELGEKIRDKYHENGEEADTIYITASKTRIIEIYNDLKNGHELNRRGYRK